MSRSALLLLAMLLASYALACVGEAGNVVASYTIEFDGTTVPRDLILVLPRAEYKVSVVYSGPLGECEGRPALYKPLLKAYTVDPEARRVIESATLRPGLDETEGFTYTVTDTGTTTTIYVRVYPMWKGVCYRSARVVVKLVGEASDEDKPRAAILAPRSLAEVAEKLAKLHREWGVETSVFTVEEVVEKFAPAREPPVRLCKEVGSGYNLTKALSIVSFARWLAEKGYKYLVILGNASQVPPLYYYSAVLRGTISGQECVPTDYFYGDPDYDWHSELAVGRIPLSSPSNYTKYLGALREWARGGEWQKRAVYAGGALFAWALFFGETVAQRLSTGRVASVFKHVDYLTLSLGKEEPDYIRDTVGDYGLYVLVMHGAGDSLLDYVPGGLWGYDFRKMLRVRDLPAAGMPGLYVSPACAGGEWDYDIVPPFFKPPSIGVALVSRGLAVAYVGYSRIAIELVTDVATEHGMVEVTYAGATWLETLFLEYLARGIERLGDAWVSALNAYLATPDAHYHAITPHGYDDVGVLTALEATFIGDPVAPNPWGTGYTWVPPKPEVKGVKTIRIPFEAVFPALMSLGSGRMILARAAPGDTVRVYFRTCPDSLTVNYLSRLNTDELIGLEKADYRVIRGVAGDCTVEIKVGEGRPSLLMITTVYGAHYYRYYILVAGMKASYREGKLVINVTGLDLARIVGDEPLYLEVNGRIVGLVPGASQDVPQVAVRGHGLLEVRLRPWYQLEGVVGSLSYAVKRASLVSEVFTARVTVKGKASLDVRVSRVDARHYLVSVLLGGEPVDSQLRVQVAYGYADTSITRLSRGLYMLSVEPMTPFVVLQVKAYYSNETLEATGVGYVAIGGGAGYSTPSALEERLARHNSVIELPPSGVPPEVAACMMLVGLVMGVIGVLAASLQASSHLGRRGRGVQG